MDAKHIIIDDETLDRVEVILLRDEDRMRALLSVGRPLEIARICINVTGGNNPNQFMVKHMRYLASRLLKVADTVDET